MRSCTCPNCNANLTIQNDDRDFAFCEFCGTKIMLDDYRETHRFVDEAEVKKAETDRMIRLKQLEIEREREQRTGKLTSLLTKLWIASIFIIGIIAIYVGMTSSMGGIAAFDILAYIGGPIVGGGAYLIFKVIPDKEADKRMMAQGGVRFPKQEQEFSEIHYEGLMQSLTIAGFTNVTAINLHDLRIGLLKKPGLISSVKVDGVEIESGGRVYDPDVSIVIEYHGV